MRVAIVVCCLSISAPLLAADTDNQAAIQELGGGPGRPRWNNTGMPKIQQSLAALYDWQQAQGKKPNNP